jgi:hypothetical protein
MRHLASALSLGLVLLAGCGGGSNSPSGGDGGNGSGGGTDFATGGGKSTSSGGGANKPDGLDGTFSYGLNAGYYNSSLNDVIEAQMGMAAGANSERLKLTEPFLDQWGDAIHVDESKQLISMGMQDFVCMTIGADVMHSNAPAGGNVENYSPKNLYEPIFTDAGDINPNNYWAVFMERLVKNYSPYIHQWEIWNEPDQVGGNWQATEAWATRAPTAKDLIWWNDSIFAYIRLLRVSYEVVHKLDPQGKVTLGGIGYPNFLDAIVRYTDEPNAGAVDADHPSKGDAYFDIVSYHYYPVFTAGSSDAGAKGIVTSHDGFQAVLDKHHVTGKTYIVTESGAPRYQLGSYPGGIDYAKNYLVKAMSLAHDAGVRRVDWFILGDGADPGASQDSFQYMGLYLNLTNVMSQSAAQQTPTGVAYASFGGLLEGSLSDPVATKALRLKSGTNGTALLTKDGQRAYVVWAETAKDENGSGSVELPLGGDAKVYAWDYSTTKAVGAASASGGKVTIPVTSSPVIVIGAK